MSPLSIFVVGGILAGAAVFAFIVDFAKSQCSSVWGSYRTCVAQEVILARK